jgi:hypothetical protein
MDIKKTQLELQHSETAVLHAASRIYAALIRNGTVTPDNEEEIMEKSIRDAIKMACATDYLVKSDDELG